MKETNNFNNPSSKTSRSSSSPELEVKRREMSDYKESIGQMNFEHLMKSFSDMLDSKLANMSTKEDISILYNKIEILSAENTMLKEDLKTQKEINKKVVKHLEYTQRELKRNNLIFKGIKIDNPDDCLNKVKEFCTYVLNISNEITIFRAKPLGKREAFNCGRNNRGNGKKQNFEKC